MGNRLSKIYTRTGDNGITGLSNGSRVKKSDARIVVIGDIDELNSAIGVVLALEPDQANRDTLIRIQQQLFNAGGELSQPGHLLIKESHVVWLENQLDAVNRGLAPLRDFVLPGGTSSAAYCHLARAICRRAERSLIALNETEAVSPVLLQYINRLSDFLFVLARDINRTDDQADMLWNPEQDN